MKFVQLTEKGPFRPDNADRCGIRRYGSDTVLCSDGLMDRLSPEQIRQITHSESDPDARARALIEAARQAGSRDNITVLTADF